MVNRERFSFNDAGSNRIRKLLDYYYSTLCPSGKEKGPGEMSWIYLLLSPRILKSFILVKNYSASATTSFTSGIILFIIPSIPAFRVIIEEGQPEHEPISIRFTTPSL